MVRRPPVAAFGALALSVALTGCAGAAPPTPQIVFVTPTPAPPTPQIIYITPSPQIIYVTPSPGPSTTTAPTTAPGTTSAPPSPVPPTSLAPTLPPTLPPTQAPTKPPTAAPPTPKPVPLSAFKIVRMALTDPNNIDPVDHTREVIFTSDGMGNVTIKLSGVAAGQQVELCVAIGDGAAKCRTTSGITLTGITHSLKTLWRVTVKGATMGMVTSVDLAVAFPSNSPDLTIKQFYLSGSSTFPSGIVVDIESRVSCPAAFRATPDDPSVPVTVDLKDISEPGSTPPPPAPGCMEIQPGFTPQGTIAKHKYELTATTTSLEEHYATLDLLWP